MRWGCIAFSARTLAAANQIVDIAITIAIAIAVVATLSRSGLARRSRPRATAAVDRVHRRRIGGVNGVHRHMPARSRKQKWERDEIFFVPFGVSVLVPVVPGP